LGEAETDGEAGRAISNPSSVGTQELRRFVFVFGWAAGEVERESEEKWTAESSSAAAVAIVVPVAVPVAALAFLSPDVAAAGCLTHIFDVTTKHLPSIAAVRISGNQVSLPSAVGARYRLIFCA
jgi:hypothetical protein